MWPSRAEALKVLKEREGTKKWDEAVLKLFVVSFFRVATKDSGGN